jgi:hypothetical protein
VGVVDGVTDAAGLALAEDGDQVDTECVEVVVDRRFAVAAIGGDRVGDGPDLGG